MTSDLELEGHRIPEGTMIYIPVWWIHRDARNWENPEKFQPERFLGTKDDGQSKERSKTMENTESGGQDRSFRNFFAFSGGARNCVGKRFALLEGTVLLGMLAREFDFIIPEDAPPVVPHRYVQ